MLLTRKNTTSNGLGRTTSRRELRLEWLEQRILLAGDTFFSGLLDFNGTVAGGSLIEMARFEGQSAGGATYNNQWTARSGNAPANGNLVTTIGAIPLLSATNSGGTSFFPAGRIVAVYASQSVASEEGGAPAGLAFDLDPSAEVDASLSPSGVAIPAAGVFKIYDRGANAGPLNAAVPTTWVPNFGNLSEGIIGELIVDGRADMASASGRFYEQGLPTNLTALPIVGLDEQDLVNVGVIDPNGAFQGLRTDLKLLLNQEMVGNPGDFFKNPQTVADPAELPAGFASWQKTSSTFPAYGEDDLLIRLEEVVNAAGFPQPTTVGLQNLETLFDFLLDMHPGEDPATLHRFQNLGAANGDAYTVTGLAQQSVVSIATTGDVVFDNTGGIGYPGAQFTPVPEIPAMLGDFVWEDLNANGIQDPDELDNGINGVTVKLLTDPDGDGVFDTIEATMVTMNNPDTGLPGWYKFNDLTPGVEYVVMFNNPDPDGPDSYMFSPRQVGGDPAIDSDGPMSDPVVLAPGEFNPTIDAGLFRKGSIHVFGFLDVDGNGIYKPVPTLLAGDGDFNLDASLDVRDLDALVAEIVAGTHTSAYDLNADGSVDMADLEMWLTVAGTAPGSSTAGAAFLPADANLDGLVDGQDFIAWNIHKFTPNNGWSGGDFNADGVTDGQDFIIWNNFKFQQSTDQMVDVPFPDDPGKTFELLDENGNVIMTDTTVDGMVWFTGLVPGTYSVRENPIPDGYALTTLPNERTYTIKSGEELVYEDGAAMLPAGDQRYETNLGDDLRWGNTQLAMLGDYVWDDKNANGIQDPEDLDRGINDVTVKLLADTDGDGTPDTQVAQTVTADNPDTNLPGFYKFNGLMPGVAYQVMFVNPDTVGPDAYMVSPFQAGGDPAIDSDANPGNNLMSDVVVLTSGEFNDTIDAGFFRKGSIHVFGFLDVDGDGIQDDHEGAFPDDPGKTFELLDENGDVIDTQTTMDGMGWFVQLVPGTYSVRENPVPDGFALTTLPNERTFTVMSGQELVYEDGAAMLPDGDQRYETNLGEQLKWGNTQLAMLGDYVWDDKNANGIQDPEDLDRGINDVTVKLLADTDGDGQVDDLVTTTVTMNNPDTGLPGWYKFNGLMPGVEYAVMFNNPDPDGPDAYMFSPRQVDGDPNSGVNSDGPMSDVVVLASGEFNDTIDAGLFRKGSIHVFGFLDVDGDGFQDDEEGAFPDDPGKTFELLDENGNVIDTQSTMNGMAWFVQLVPGTYSVRENPIPDGYELTTLPNTRTFTVMSGQELVYEDGAAMLPDGDQRYETNLGDQLKWGNTQLVPGIDIEKFTNGVDADTEDEAPLIAPGDTVTWTYIVTNTGQVPFTFDEVEVIDDNGTPGDPTDDFMPTFIPSSDVGGDLILSPGEAWMYEATGIALDLTVSGPPIVIDFDTDGLGNPLGAGTIIDDEYANFGLTITSNSQATNPAMIFNSANPTGNDPDLGTPNQDFGGPGVGAGGQAGAAGENSVPLGNILIISEDGDQTDPDDDAGGGTLSFIWDNAVTVDTVSLLDIDLNEPNGTITFTLLDGSQTTVPIPTVGNNGFELLAVNLDNVVRMDVNLQSSGAVTELVFRETERVCYRNVATVTAGDVSDWDPSHYCNPVLPQNVNSSGFNGYWFESNTNSEGGESGTAALDRTNGRADRFASPAAVVDAALNEMLSRSGVNVTQVRAGNVSLLHRTDGGMEIRDEALRSLAELESAEEDVFDFLLRV